MLDNYRFYEVVTYNVSDEPALVKGFSRKELPESLYDWKEICTSPEHCTCYYCVYGR